MTIGADTTMILLAMDWIFGAAHCGDGTLFPPHGPHDFCTTHGGGLAIAMRGYAFVLLFGVVLGRRGHLAALAPALIAPIMRREPPLARSRAA